MSTPHKNQIPHPGGRPPLPAGEASDAFLHLRVQRRRKAAYVRAAKLVAKKL